ncbi:putative aminotransferase tcpI [Pseudocercospora fuligena]|uniref:Putative aminotransferase tcpI n=1 Tax=Pseudocercospora fuligena TaxID=685502 RepID=A0A8H6RBQ1_9PEZI|nr:putative aminotransferase tcpI [Pseudocercospora fuligena]
MGEAPPMERLPYLSDRVKDNLKANKLAEVRAWCYDKQYDPITNPDGVVALAIAENKLMRDEITKHINENFKINPWHLTYGEGPAGTTALRRHIASYVNEYFRPSAPVKANHIATCNGAGPAVNNFCFCVGEPGDGILLSKPLYTGFFGDIEHGSKFKLVQVPMEGIDPVSVEAVAQYEETLHQAEASGTKIRAVLLANPHNPLGRPYSKEALAAFCSFCDKYNIHLLSDEVYAQSWFLSKDFPKPEPFVSILSLDLEKYINPALIHVIYAMSKDFCANGIRVGCLISPSNDELLSAFKSISGFTRASQLAEQVWLNLFEDGSFLNWYFPEMRRRLADSYAYVTGRLEEQAISYSPASTGVCVWIDLSEYLEHDTRDAELALDWRLARAKVWIAMGATFVSEKHGNYRITFATPRADLELGLDRLFKVLSDIREERGLMTGSNGYA